LFVYSATVVLTEVPFVI